MSQATIAESVSERQAICDGITMSLEEGEVDRQQLSQMMVSLTGIGHELNWELRGHLTGRAKSAEMLDASRWLRSATEALNWADQHAAFALRFEIARCVEVANNAILRVVDAVDK